MFRVSIGLREILCAEQNALVLPSLAGNTTVSSTCSLRICIKAPDGAIQGGFTVALVARDDERHKVLENKFCLGVGC